MKTFLHAVLCAFVLVFAAGCASSVTESHSVDLMRAQTLTKFAPSVVSPLPTKGATAQDSWNAPARADHLVGSIAGSLGASQHELDAAHAQKDASRVSCINPKVVELTSIERNAREGRVAIRAAALDDDESSGPYNQLMGFEARARQLRSEAIGCAASTFRDARFAARHRVTTLSEKAEDVDGYEDQDGIPEPDRDGDGILDQKDTMRDEPALGPAKARSVIDGKAAIVAGTQSVATKHDTSMIIHTGEIALAVYEVAKNIQTVEKMTAELGGYLSLRSDREITVRVPREKFDELVSRIEKMGDVLHKNIAAEDVTDQYVDIDMRLRNATAVRERLEKLLVSATVRDAVEIHKELSKVTEEIERYEGKLKLLRDRIAYSTITVTFEQQQSQQVKSQALLPFPWMTTMGLSPLLQVQR